MSNKIVVLGFVFLALAGGYFLGTTSLNDDGTVMSNTSDAEILYWVAPMDSNYRKTEPGKSPMGMDLVPVYDAAGEVSDNEIRIDPATTQNLGVRTATATVRPWLKTIRAVGRVAWNGGSVQKVYARTEGWLEAFSIESVGQTVTKGQFLFGIYAPQLVSAQQEFISAVKSGNRQLIRNSRMRLLALGVSDSQASAIQTSRKVQRLLPFKATSNSVVVSLSAARGSFVTPNSEIATLVGTDSIWVEANIHEADMGELKQGQDVSVRFSAYPGRTWQGKVDHIYPSLDISTRTVKLRVQLDNLEMAFRQGMFAEVDIHTASGNALQIPKESVIRSKRGNRVVVEVGNGHYAVKPVIIGAENADSVVVLEGLNAGEQLVTSAQFLLDSEANGYQALERLSSLRYATASATVVGFPQRGQIRLLHEPIGELGWPSMNKVFDVDSQLSLTPFNKNDRVLFEISHALNGDWIVTGIEPLQPGAHAAQITREGMSHD